MVTFFLRFFNAVLLPDQQAIQLVWQTIVLSSVDVMSYVLEQVPPPYPGLPRPRFSLYLSSQLQYGIILVYHRQCAILLGEELLQD